MREAVEQVIQTTTQLVEGHITDREAITILATLTREAVPAALELRASDPDRADVYRELVMAIAAELRGRPQSQAQPQHTRHRDSVLQDLDAVVKGLA